MALGDGLDISNPQSAVSGVFNVASGMTAGPELAPPSPAEPTIEVAGNERIWTPADSAARAGVLGLPATPENKALGLKNMGLRS
jgi:hypothetical protein